jgi:RHS repeat-associated protein
LWLTAIVVLWGATGWACAVYGPISGLHNDFAGNPIAATDASGAIIWKENFRPYGDRLDNQPASSGNRQWFHGKSVDSDTGLSYFGARYYDATLGRFMGVDPDGNSPHLIAAPLLAAMGTGALIFGGIDVGMQYITTGKVNWRSVAESAAEGAQLLVIGKMLGGGGSAAEQGAVRGTNATGELTSRGSFWKSTLNDAWENAAPGPTGGRLCPTCTKEVNVPPNSGKSRDWDGSHNPSWSNREFPADASRKDVLDNYNKGVSLECPSCNRSGGANDARFGQ